MTTPRLPTTQVPLTDANNRMTTAWYRALSDTVTQLETQISKAQTLLTNLTALQKTVKGIPRIIYWGTLAGTVSDQSDLQALLDALAPIDSPAFTTAVGFNGAAAIGAQNITGAKGGNVALANLLTALAAVGLVTDSTT